MPSDCELMREIVAGNKGAFDALFERHAPKVRGRLKNILRNEAAAEDTLQDVFLRVWTRAEQYDGRGSVTGWLMRTATNLALNHLRSTRRRRQRPLVTQRAPDEDAENAVPGWMVDEASLRPDELMELAERRSACREAIDALPELKREVIRLVHEAEMDISEVADRLGIPPGTVKSRLHYARGDLAERLGGKTREGDDLWL